MSLARLVTGFIVLSWNGFRVQYASAELETETVSPVMPSVRQVSSGRGCYHMAAVFVPQRVPEGSETTTNNGRFLLRQVWYDGTYSNGRCSTVAPKSRWPLTKLTSDVLNHNRMQHYRRCNLYISQRRHLDMPVSPLSARQPLTIPCPAVASPTPLPPKQQQWQASAPSTAAAQSA